MVHLGAIVDPLGLVERAGRSLRGRALESLLKTAVEERLVERVLDDPNTEQLLEQALSSAGGRRLVARTLDSDLPDLVAARLLAGPALWRIVDEVASSPAMTDAIARQSAGLVEQVADEVGTRSRRADERLEHAARRLLRRPQRPGPGDHVGTERGAHPR